MRRNPHEPRPERGHSNGQKVDRRRGARLRPEARRRLPEMEALEGRQLLATTGSNPLVSEIPIPALAAVPSQITMGPDRAIWFTENGTGEIGRLGANGVITQFPVITPGSAPFGITAGPDGNVWFTDQGLNAIGRITPTGAITEVVLPNARSVPADITSGPDGNLWFTEKGGDRIGKITPLGLITEFDLPTASASPLGITAGPDGNVWFTESNAFQIGRINPGTNAISEVSTNGLEPNEITRGLNNQLWFSVLGTGAIGQVNVLTGAVTPFATPTVLTNGTGGITLGPDGAIWFTEPELAQFGRIDLQDNVTEISLGTGVSTPTGLALGANGNLFFTDPGNNAVGIYNQQVPQVTVVQRLGNSSEVTGFVLTFSAPLDPFRATNVDNYTLTTAGPDGHFDPPSQLFAGKANDVYLHLQGASYNAALQTVTLILSNPISVGVPIDIRVNGNPVAGLTGANFTFLNGDFTGTGGTNFDLIVRGVDVPTVGAPAVVPTPDQLTVAHATRRRHTAARTAAHPTAHAHVTPLHRTTRTKHR
jgi:virginiamycin B lyase